MTTTGPDGAPRDDGSDVRWGSDWQYIVSLYPDTKPYLWAIGAQVFDQALRARPLPGEPLPRNPFQGDDPQP